jgi:hypothetical protein
MFLPGDIYVGMLPAIYVSLIEFFKSLILNQLITVWKDDREEKKCWNDVSTKKIKEVL